jgi:hypothetical protein
MKRCILPMMFLFLPGGLMAQSTFGTILGTATDPSGALVPDVTVTITNLDENISRETTSDAQGNYEFQNLKAGHYRVVAKKQGFKEFTATDLLLEARQTLRVNAALQVGELVETVSVEGAAAVITTETQTIAATFNTQQVLEIPANYRGRGSTSPYSILAYLPGVQADNGNNFSIQGALPHQNEVTVDGISTVDIRGNGPLREMFPSVEGIAEMKVQGVGSNAEYGQIGDITTTSKGGSNSFHGSAFEYLQNRKLDATAFGSVTKPQKTANTFGGSFSGPVIRNHTFFFVDYEGMRYRSGTTVQNTVPTAAMRVGDFSLERGTVRDPLTGEAFPGNRVPDSRISPIAKKIINYYPLPNFGRTDVETSGNFRENRAAPILSDQYDIRIDHLLTNKQQIFGRWTWKNISQISPTRLLFPPDDNFNENRNLVISHNYTISPRWLNEFRFGLSRNFRGGSFPIDGARLVQDLGLQGLGPNFPPNGIPNVIFGGLTSNFAHGRNGVVHSQSWQANNNTTWTRGRHTIKFGVDIRRLRSTDITSFTTGDDYGDFDFEGRFSGNDFADFLLGIPDASQISRTGPDSDGRVWHYHFYAQDSFKLSPKLTLEYGLRYEYHPPFKDEQFNISNFDRTVPITGRVVIPSDPLAQKITAPGFLTSINACPVSKGPVNGVPCTPFLTAKEANWPETLRFPWKKNFDPRVGFAYRPFSDTKTVIRGGAGIFTMTILGSVFYSLTAIHSSDVTAYQNSLQGGRPVFQWPQTSGGVGIGSVPVGTQDFRTANGEHFRDPYSIQWNLSVEREVGWSTGLRVSYIGLRSIHLPWAPDLNQPQPSTTPFTRRPLTDRPFPNWNIIFSRDSGGNGIYNALQTELTHRFKSGLTLDSAWTWSKNIADNAGPAPSGYAAENGGGRNTNSLCRACDRGNVAASRRHRWISTFVYELPFGKGKQFGGSMNPIAHAIVGGWRLSGIMLLQTGPFLTPIMSGGDPSGTNAIGRGTQRPDAVGNIGGNLDNPTADVWWNRSAFVCPGRTPGASDQFNCNVGAIGRFGNAGVGTLVGPGTVNLSMGFGKDFRVTEKSKLKFDGSFSNLPNHPNLADPSNNITTSSFGRITSARGADSGGNRVGQFSLRLEF